MKKLFVFISVSIFMVAVVSAQVKPAGATADPKKKTQAASAKAMDKVEKEKSVKEKKVVLYNDLKKKIKVKYLSTNKVMVTQAMKPWEKFTVICTAGEEAMAITINGEKMVFYFNTDVVEYHIR